MTKLPPDQQGEPNEEPEAEKPANPSSPKGPKGPKEINEFHLEDLYSSPAELFKPYFVPSVADKSLLVALDTNALLLPYTVSKKGLPGLGDVYNKLARENRLKLPGRVAREFIQNRDRKLADIVQNLNNTRSKINIGEAYLSPLLEGITENEELIKASKKMSEAKKAYSDALDKIEAQLRGWRGNDPVTRMYSEVFSDQNIVELEEDRAALSKEWNMRRLSKVPPGYKDASKDDTGIGDFIIWKSLLKIGSTEKKDIVFVTGEEKADWFVRQNNRGLYPRPELVHEYRKISQGKNIRLASLHELLEEMEAPSELVSEIETAERFSNNTYNFVNSEHRNYVASLDSPLFVQLRFPYGGSRTDVIVSGRIFNLEFSEASQDASWLYAQGSSVEVGVIDNIPPDRGVPRELLKGSREPCLIRFDNLFYVINVNDEILLGRLMSTNYDPESRQERRDMVIMLRFRSFASGQPLFAP